jgi:NitT/TauT family transport system permease protein
MQRWIETKNLYQLLVGALTVIALLLVWQGAIVVFKTPGWLVPSPAQVWASFVKNHSAVAYQVMATGASALGGLVLGSLAAIALAVGMSQWSWLERVLMPILLIDQSIPKTAIAPLLIIWFGAGFSSRVAIAVVVSFFPMVIGTLFGLRSIDRRLGRLFHSLAATRLEMLVKVRLPNALPHIFSALKVTAPLAVTGAIVAEFVQAKSGIGYMIMMSLTDFNTPLVFVAVIAAAFLSLSLYCAAAALPVLIFGGRFSVLMQAQSRQ